MKNKDEERFNSMALGSMDAQEDFNEFEDDRAIIWAYKEIKRLRKELEEINNK